MSITDPAEGTEPTDALGSGRFSVVYRWRTPSGRDIALKRVRRPSHQKGGTWWWGRSTGRGPFSRSTLTS